MSITRQTYGDLFEMPAGLRKFVLSQEFEDADATLQKTYALTDDQKNKMGDEVMAAIYNEEDLAKAVANVRASVVPTPVPETKWKDFLSDFLRLEAWPLRELFGPEIRSILLEQQIATSSWPQFHILLRPLTYSGAATEVATRLGITLMGGQLHERLRDLIVSRIKSVRVDSQVREVLVRPSDFGGVGLDPEMADKTIVAINELIAAVPIMAEDEYANWLAEEARKKAEPAKAEATAPVTPEDAEIAAIRANMPAIPVQMSVLDEAVEKTIAELDPRPSDPYLLGRLEHVVSSRFRDVRSAFEVLQLLLRDPKVGGMGLEKEQAERLAAKVEQAYKTFHDPIMADEKKMLEQQVETQKVKVDERRKREAEEHAKWYQDRISARKKDEDQKQQLAEQMKATMLAYATGETSEATAAMDVKEQKQQTARFGEMVPAVAVGATPVAGPAASAPSKDAPPAITASPLPSAAPRAARPEVKVSMETVKLQQAQPPMKPRMDDVVFTGGPKLVGLSGELSALTLAEFRRMGKDANAAAQKIMQKIETLGQESFEKRLDGIKAFQASPLQGQYVRLVTESFRQGRSVTDLAAQRTGAGKEELNPDEVAAIISLNSKLHY